MAEIRISPAITFEILDLDEGGAPGGDGNGDEIFPGNFDTVVLGPNGEAAEYAEFDINGFDVVLGGEAIASAVLEAEISSFAVFGLGTGNDRPEQLGVYGYEGNGQADASDLQLSEQITSIDTAGVEVGDTIQFDVTDLVTEAVASGDEFVGLGIRAEETGALALRNSPFEGSPRLFITTEQEAPPEGKKIRGTAGDDVLTGTAGDDEIIGRRGDDILAGGDGSDRFVYRGVRDGRDRIVDFEVGTDFIDLSRLFDRPKFSNSQPLERYVQIIQLGADTAIQIDKNGDSGGDRRDIYKTLATLENTQATDLTPDNFIV